MTMTKSIWSLAGRTVVRNKARTALMSIGLIVGVVSITLTQATGEGARHAVRQSFKAMIGALDVLFVQPGGAAQRGMANLASSITTLTAADAEAIAQSVPKVKAVGALSAPIEVAGKSGTTALFGSSPNWVALRGDSVAAGAFYTENDDRAMARVAVIGADVARDYFPTGSAVGQPLRVSGVDFKVVGVLAPNGAGPGGVSIDNLVYIPFETGRRRVFNRDNLTLMSVKLVDPNKWAETQGAVHALVRQRHGRSGDQLDDFRVSSPEAMMARVASVDTTLRKALLWVGVLALVIGGVVVANLMFAATVARRTEIATRRAVGATRSDVLRQFWAEAVLVSATAAAVGAAIAVVLTQLGAAMMRMQLAVSWPVTAGTIATTVAIGALAGYFPARKAAALAPGEALRDPG
jgi:ABC-type antimicrobial peptide transport system permease subunit